MAYVMRHNCNKKMYRVHFTNNWYIDVTEDHSLMGYQSVHFNQKKEVKKNPLNRIIEIKPDEIKYASDNMEKYYGFAEKLIEKGEAYVCSCPQEDIKLMRREGKDCIHRNQEVKRIKNIRDKNEIWRS